MDANDAARIKGLADFWDRVETWAFFAVVVALAVEFVAHRMGAPHRQKLDEANEVTIADSNARAEEAQKTSESFRRDIALANERSASAQAEAARFNEIAERERLARVNLEEKLRPRALTTEQQDRIVAKIGQFAGTPFELVTNTDPESLSLITTFDAVLRKAKWEYKDSEKKSIRFTYKLPSGSVVEQGTVSGISVQISTTLREKYEPALMALSNALLGEGLEVQAMLLPENDPSPNAIHVIAGSK